LVWIEDRRSVGRRMVMTSRRSMWVATALAALAAVPLSAYAQIVPNNPYAQVLVDTSRAINNFTGDIINSQPRTQNSSGTWCSPLPPYELMRGMDGHVPPELQSDPRYQEWLRCQKSGTGAAPPQTMPPVLAQRNPSPQPTGFCATAVGSCPIYQLPGTPCQCTDGVYLYPGIAH
jgi:hypothetical protein